MLSAQFASGTDPCRQLVAKYLGLPVADAADTVGLYWCEGLGRPPGPSVALRLRGRSVFTQNFGDALSPFIVSLLTGRGVRYAAGPGKLLALGSVFFALRDHDIVWGTGLGRVRDVAYAQRARHVTYTAVRGPRTWTILRAFGIDCPRVFGDPALLLPLYVANDIEPDAELGIVPHWTHFSTVVRACTDTHVRVVDVMAPMEDVARQILGCRMVLATSLHGLIVAEAYGIPAMFVSIEGTRRMDVTKFADYFESTDRDLCFRHVDHPKRLYGLTREIAKVPRPRFVPRPLLAAFPGTVRAPTQVVTSWSRVSIARPADNMGRADIPAQPSLIRTP